jgi:hypothetical protein
VAGDASCGTAGRLHFAGKIENKGQKSKGKWEGNLSGIILSAFRKNFSYFSSKETLTSVE